ncbi:Hippocampus abundant transcript 1 protein [Armadillidium nasatum]|uniref:Hippocampus abundant transcript 1 protein n=1 Tax=Armadillidium nasatum TaxID=96803 RepID=A0A5N5TG24_9CRUS|nr:Hippocampus abundant transcript 1 protein [Armadillidium nasatum]
MNGIIMGIKGLLSFLSAPLIGALSDTWGRKFFLFITVFFTCLPIPFMKINTWWYFALISMSGVFAVTYSIVFAYVADVTDPAERHHAYGLVSASFAASLVTSPALGAYLSKVHSDDLVVGLATAIAVLDIFFILVAVPESLPEKLRISSTSTWSTPISWENADPFSTLWKVSKDKNILLISVTVFLSYLPEAGQLSCFFVYLQLVMGFGPEMVATFIAVVGIMSVVAQTALLGLLIRTLSNKRVISVGLVFELLQLMWYGFGSQTWMMWAAGILAAISSITYPAISAYISTHTDIDKQVESTSGGGVGVGGAGIGGGNGSNNNNNSSLTQGHHIPQISPQVPGPPFVFGAMLVLLALTVSAFIPEGSVPKNRKQSAASALDLGYSRDHKKSDSLDGTSQPLMNESGVL